MKLKTFKDKRHFLLYCALFFNQGEKIDNHEIIDTLKVRITNTLDLCNFNHLNMPDHSYHYFMGLYNPSGYLNYGQVLYPDKEFLEYIEKLGNVSELDDIYREYEPGLDEKLRGYENKFEYLNTYFDQHYDFEPKTDKFSFTRNWDASGKCVPTNNGTLIFVGWLPKGLNSIQIIHELTHSFIDVCDLPVSELIEGIRLKCPNYIKNSYGTTQSFAEDSLIRALVVYFDKSEGETFGFSFTKMDIDMKLPELYLSKLQKDGLDKLSKEYINSFSL